MGWFALIFFLVAFFLAYCTDKVDSNMKEKYGASYVDKFKYCGGNDKIVQDCDVWLYWFFRGNFLVIQYKLGLNKIEESIPYERIIKISGKTEIQIKNDVTLTRLALFGIFAFGLKKEKKETNYFLVIEYINDEGENQKLILSGVNQSQLNNYNQLLKDYRKTKENNVEEINEIN